MQDLVDATGVNRASLYGTYGDKRALFFDALHAYDDRRKRMISELRARYAPRAAIERLFEIHIEDVDENGRNRGCFLTNTALELADHDPSVRSIVESAQRDIEDFFSDMVRQGKADGDFRPDLDPVEAGRGLLASLLGVVVLVRSRPDRALLRSATREAVRRLE